jgi:molecular chaperone DnaK
MAKEIIVGIDLGTTNSRHQLSASRWQSQSHPEPGRHQYHPVGRRFQGDGEEIVGNAAKRQMITNPDTVRSAKRHMGTPISSTSAASTRTSRRRKSRPRSSLI